MRLRTFVKGAVVVALASALGLGASLAANADTSGEIDIGVVIDPNKELYMEVAPGGLNLVEDTAFTAVPNARAFKGLLPEVTVYDLRSPAEVAADGVSWWSVMGYMSDFEDQAGVKGDIAAKYFGWVPVVTADGANPDVHAGDPVDSFLEGGDGLVAAGSFAPIDGELLFMNLASDSAATAVGFEYKATANVALIVPRNTAPADYKAKLSLNLFEG